MIQSSEKHMIANRIKKLVDEKKIDFSIAIQRKLVWNTTHKYNLIAAILLYTPIDPFMFERDPDHEGSYLCLDGKQRSFCLHDYLNNKFAIGPSCKVHEVEGVNIVGKKFSDLPKAFQERLEEKEFEVTYMEPMTEAERELVFFFRNQAVPLTGFEQVRASLGERNLDILDRMASHSFLTAKANVLSSRNQDEQLVLECGMIYDNELYDNANACFSTSGLRNYSEKLLMMSGETRTKALASLEPGILRVFDYLDDSIPEKMKIFRNIHVPAVFYVAKEAMNQDVASEVFGEWLESFFEEIRTTESPYSEYTSNGSAKRENIVGRFEYIKKHFHGFLSMTENGEKGGESN